MMTENKVYRYIKDGEGAFSARADRDIERNRKGNFELVISDAAGNPVKNARITAHMTKIDFNFGANIFMLGESVSFSTARQSRSTGRAQSRGAAVFATIQAQNVTATAVRRQTPCATSAVSTTCE